MGECLDRARAGESVGGARRRDDERDVDQDADDRHHDEYRAVPAPGARDPADEVGEQRRR